MKTNKKNIILFKILLHIVVIVILCISFFSIPGESKLYLPCYIRSITGFLCPICGSSRSLHALVHGNFLFAIRSNVFLVITICTGFLFYITTFVEKVFKKKVTVKISYKCGYIITVILMVYGIIRNIPYFPFTYLTP